MNKLITLALSTFLFVIFMTSVFFQVTQPTIAQNIAQQIAMSHQKDTPIPSPLVAQVPTIPVTEQTVTYGNINNKPIMGYLARPQGVKNPLPALIIIHEWWGLNDNIKAMTQRLAGEGYTALAVDLYKGKVADNPEKAKELVTSALKNPQELRENLKAAYQYLEQEQKAPKIASIGWCLGGTWSLNTALLFPDQLDATIIYYGGGITTDAAQLKALQMPILGFFGGLDNNPSVETVKEFETVLKSLNKAVEIHIYDEAGHAFANPSGNRYNAIAAEDSWKRTIAFLNQSLKE